MVKELQALLGEVENNQSDSRVSLFQVSRQIETLITILLDDLTARSQDPPTDDDQHEEQVDR